MTDRPSQVLASIQGPPAPRFRRSSRTSLWTKEFRRSCHSHPPPVIAIDALIVRPLLVPFGHWLMERLGQWRLRSMPALAAHPDSAVARGSLQS